MLYLQEGWAADGFEMYREALRKHPDYRHDEALIRSAMRTFVSVVAANAARGIAFLRDDIGEPAIPYLEQARESRNPTIRQRAETTLAQIRKRR